MTTIYLVILCAALAATLCFIALCVREWSLSRHQLDTATGGGADRACPRPLYDGVVDCVLVAFPIAAAGMVAGLLIAGSTVRILDIGAEAMLVACGASAAERLLWRGREGGVRTPLVAPLCLVVGLVGGLAGLGP